MAKSSSSGLIGVAYLPHGTMLLDPNREDLPNGVKSLHLTCMKISEKIAELNPDLIILLTPHGINLHQAINIYQPGVLDSTASGNAEWNNNWIDYSVDVKLDGETCQDLYLYLKQNLQRVEGMLAFCGFNVPLRWGEVVPLYFTLYQLVLKTKTNNNSTLKNISIQSKPKVIIIAQPMKGTTTEERNSYIEEQRTYLVKFGRLIRSWCNKSSQRILLVISGDQAHTHAWSSQLPTIYQPDPTCFSKFPQCGTEHSKLFDEIIHDWITGKRSNSETNLYKLDEKLIINEAGNIEKFALSCGYVGSLTMQGIMENDLIQNRIDDSSKPIEPSSYWLLTNFISSCPTYYGMMAALYIRNFE
ncbi:unnamed protein product [Rotaria sordida]|uniref:Extradiol ring-cleavage dioxygenase class III enzyme subunit B domain-containing protein n=1 Tax=Rotaria sordida TaxID=392033 RepID=A0A816EBR7_9BILA|nr:unnamed protein product [Rotaria sordida]CAF0802242.1 unnamed protein product [Rotaria sordida]CAF1650535.1 unnamed protein product [Rotaria sordida]